MCKCGAGVSKAESADVHSLAFTVRVDDAPHRIQSTDMAPAIKDSCQPRDLPTAWQDSVFFS